MKKLKLISTILLIALCAAMFTMPTMAVEDPAPEADAAMLVDIATGNTIYSKNESEQRAPASLTKIMTVLLAVEAVESGERSLGDAVTASSNSTADLIDDGSTANIVPGETMSLENLMYCAMVKSANEACNIIAEHISGSISAFVDKMNARASELGCTGTHFANTHGLPSSEHYTTAKDMSIIALEAISHAKFMEICNTPEITIDATNVADSRHLVNTNGLIAQNAEPYSGYYYEYAKGVKTGHTDAAGYCLISTAEKNGMNYLCVVMGGKATPNTEGVNYGSFTDSIKLYNWAFENYSYRDILKMTDAIRDIPVAMGSEADHVSVHPQESVRVLLANDDNLESFVQRIKIYSEESGEELVAPINAGEVLGEISLERDGVVYGSSPLIASSSIGLSYSQFISSRIKETISKPVVLICIMIIAVLLVAYIFLVVRYRLSRRKYLKNQKLQQRAARARAFREQEPLPQQSAPALRVRLPRQRAERHREERYYEEPSQPAPPSELPLMTPEQQAERDYFEEFFGNNNHR